MHQNSIEHVNVTVTDPGKTTAFLRAIFDWKVRWEGPAKGGGYTIHVGTDDHYLAVYSAGQTKKSCKPSYKTSGGLNHIGVVVDDLLATEARVKEAGFVTHSHSDYEPGHRFYFHDNDGIEFEVVSYAES